MPNERPRGANLEAEQPANRDPAKQYTSPVRQTSQKRNLRNEVIDAAQSNIDRVLQACGVRFRTSGNEHRMCECPGCGPHSTACVCVNATSGRWHCKSGDCSGDVFDLVTGFQKLGFAQALAFLCSVLGIATEGRSGRLVVFERADLDLWLNKKKRGAL
jgi:hypothetical protein